MLQDIAPHHLYNQYRKKSVSAKSKVFHFAGRNVYISRAEDEQLQLPAFEEILKIKGNGSQAVSFSDAGNTLQYLFSIEDEDFFLLMDKQELPENDKYHYETVRTMRQLVSKEVCFSVMTAYHLYVWYNNNRFCGHCVNR